MTNWLMENCGFRPQQYIDLFQIPLPKVDNPHAPRPSRTWMVVTASIQDRDQLVGLDSMVLEQSGCVRIVNDFTTAEHAKLKAIDPFLVGLTTRPVGIR